MSRRVMNVKVYHIVLTIRSLDVLDDAEGWDEVRRVQLIHRKIGAGLDY